MSGRVLFVVLHIAASIAALSLSFFYPGHLSILTVNECEQKERGNSKK